MTSTHAYASTRTRAEAVVDQFDLFLMCCGVPDAPRGRVVKAVTNKWISDAAAYLVDGAGSRFLEAEVGVKWDLASDLARLSPTVRTDLPGWSDAGAAPEIRVLGQRFGTEARRLGLTPSVWIRFLPEIKSNRARYLDLCSQLGYAPDSQVPDWKSPPKDRQMDLLDLPEVTATLRHVE